MKRLSVRRATPSALSASASSALGPAGPSGAQRLQLGRGELARRAGPRDAIRVLALGPGGARLGARGARLGDGRTGQRLVEHRLLRRGLHDRLDRGRARPLERRLGDLGAVGLPSRDGLRLERAEVAEAALERARATAVRVETVVEAPPEQAVLDEALARAAVAEASATRAEARAARAEREYAEVAVAATGAPRKLTAAELEALRSDGPAGPALLADALKALGVARRTDNRFKLEEALAHVASAAVTWRDRL